MAQGREDKPGAPRLRAALSAVVRSAMRRARGARAAPLPSPDAPQPRPLDLAEERAASRDLLAIDSVVRRFYALRSAAGGAGDWELLRALFHEDARLGTVAPDAGSSAGTDGVPVDRFIERERERAADAPSRFGERSRTVHVLGELAVVISAYEVRRGDPASAERGVSVLHLRRSGRGWLIQTVLAQPVERAITEKSADPRPFAPRRG